MELKEFVVLVNADKFDEGDEFKVNNTFFQVTKRDNQGAIRDWNNFSKKQQNSETLISMYKDVALEVAKEHHNCQSDCKVSLVNLMCMAEASGVRFTEEEKMVFL